MKYLLLILITVSLTGVSCKKAFEPEPGKDPEALFEEIWRTFQHEYAPFEERKVDWHKQYAIYRARVTTNTTEEELFNILCEMLAVLDDGHVTLTAPNRQLFVSNRIFRDLIDDELFSKGLIRDKYLEPGYKTGPEESYIHGKIKGANIGYIWFDYVGGNFYELKPFLARYETAKGLIIDLRHNQGGDFTFCFSEMGRLTDQPRMAFRSKTKNGPGEQDYTAWTDWYVQPEGKYLDKPIIVLTDRYTISAGERSVMAFKTLPNVTTLGDTTSGAHGTMIGRELPNGWFYSLVPQKILLPDGKSYEGIGLAPDVYVRNTSAEMNNGLDKVLQTAVERLQ